MFDDTLKWGYKNNIVYIPVTAVWKDMLFLPLYIE